MLVKKLEMMNIQPYSKRSILIGYLRSITRKLEIGNVQENVYNAYKTH